MNTLMNYKWILLLLILSLVFFLIGQFLVPMFLAFAGGTFASANLIFIAAYIDDKVLGEVDTKTEIIDNRNMAYALYYLANCIIIAVAFAAAFLVFLTLK